MADLLRSGNTMLNIACPICNNPIFRNKDGKTFCPTCNREVLIGKNEHLQHKKTKKKEIHYENEQIIKKKKDYSQFLYSLKDVLFEKIQLITQKLKDETQISLIKTYVNLLSDCFDILNKINF